MVPAALFRRHGRRFGLRPDPLPQQPSATHPSAHRGAVSAVVFASIFFNPWSKIYLLGVIPIPGIIFGLLYIGYSSYMGRRQGDRINHFAHLFGALFGFLFPLLMNPSFFSVFWDNLTK